MNEEHDRLILEKLKILNEYVYKDGLKIVKTKKDKVIKKVFKGFLSNFKKAQTWGMKLLGTPNLTFLCLNKLYSTPESKARVKEFWEKEDFTTIFYTLYSNMDSPDFLNILESLERERISKKDVLDDFLGYFQIILYLYSDDVDYLIQLLSELFSTFKEYLPDLVKSCDLTLLSPSGKAKIEDFLKNTLESKNYTTVQRKSIEILLSRMINNQSEFEYLKKRNEYLQRKFAESIVKFLAGSKNF
ncbi:MAG: hypothetical protein HWN66_13365 [Candidatus Helarchaeota archaeon]|nr:hypothetical protein [Candidatus Helarchaeota archaeon]